MVKDNLYTADLVKIGPFKYCSAYIVTGPIVTEKVTQHVWQSMSLES